MRCLLSAAVLFFHLASSTSPIDSAELLFQAFKIRFQKQYASSEEEAHRFVIFKQTLKNKGESRFYEQYASPGEEAGRFGILSQALDLDNIDALNLSDIVSSHLTPFADWTVEEFLAKRTQPQMATSEFLATSDVGSKALFRPGQVNTLDTTLAMNNLPKEWDWTKKGAVTGVKDQGHCGSCWAFAAVGHIEGRNFVENGTLQTFSAQQLQECVPGGHQCPQGGGNCLRAFRYFASTRQKLRPESVYAPYNDAWRGTCKNPSIPWNGDQSVYVEDVRFIQQSEEAVAAALVKYGPLAVHVKVGSEWQSYKGGVLDPSFFHRVGFGVTNHEVTLVGFGVTNDGDKFWKMKNSWGEDWGEGGYVRLARGSARGATWPHGTSNMYYGIATVMSVVPVSKKDCGINRIRLEALRSAA